jgi:hypothetical protein
LGGKRHDKRRGADAGNYPEDNDRNDDAKHTPEEAAESGPIYPCTTLAVFKILELFPSDRWRTGHGGGRHVERRGAEDPTPQRMS